MVLHIADSPAHYMGVLLLVKWEGYTVREGLIGSPRIISPPMSLGPIPPSVTWFVGAIGASSVHTVVRRLLAVGLTGLSATLLLAILLLFRRAFTAVAALPRLVALLAVVAVRGVRVVMGVTTSPRCVIPLLDALALLLLVRLPQAPPPAPCPSTRSPCPALVLAAQAIKGTSRISNIAMDTSLCGYGSPAGYTCRMRTAPLARRTEKAAGTLVDETAARFHRLLRLAALAHQFEGGAHRLGRVGSSPTVILPSVPTRALPLLVEVAKFEGEPMRLGAMADTLRRATNISWRPP